MTNSSFAFLLSFLFAALVGLGLMLLRPESTGTPLDQVLENRAKWEARRPERYAVSMERLCFCEPWSIRAEVDTSGDPQITFKEPPPRAIHDDRRYFPRSIDDVFVLIERYYSERAYRITIEFDETLGYPTHVDIDRNEQIIDDELVLSLSEFAPRHVG